MSWFKPEQDAVVQGRPHSQTISDEPAFTLQDLTPGKTVHLWNDGRIHLHQVMEAALQYTGRAEVYLCSWSISVPAMKAMLRLCAAGSISSISALVDYRTRKDHPEAFEMARHLFRCVKILPCHAKVIVLIGEHFSASIIGSANLTNNPKQERIAICTDPLVVQNDRGKIQQMLEKGVEP